MKNIFHSYTCLFLYGLIFSSQSLQFRLSIGSNLAHIKHMHTTVSNQSSFKYIFFHFIHARCKDWYLPTSYLTGPDKINIKQRPKLDMTDESPNLWTCTCQYWFIVIAPPVGYRKYALCDKHHSINMKFTLCGPHLTFDIQQHNVCLSCVL